MPEPLDPTEWPRWFHHVARASVLCATPEDAAELPEGFRKAPWSDEDKHAAAMHAAADAKRAHTTQVKRLEEAVTTPVEAPPPQVAAKAKAPPPRRLPVRPRPRR